MSKKGSKKSQSEEPRPDYALVFYQYEKKKGVVLSSLIAKSVRNGSTINAPQPVDWEGDPKRSKATLLKFGHSINYLNDLEVYFDNNGIVVNPHDQGTSRTATRAGSKRKLSKHEEELRSKNSKLLDDNIQELDDLNNLSSEKISDQIIPTEVHQETVIQASQITKPSTSLQSQTITTEANQETEEQASQMTKPSASVQSQTIPTDVDQEILKQTTQVESSISGERMDAGKASSSGTTTNILSPLEFYHSLMLTSQKENFDPNLLLSTSAIPASISPGARANIALECYKPHPQKGLLIETQPVFVWRSDLLNIPFVVPRPRDTPARQKKPKDGPVGAVYPQELVKRLLQILIPDQIMITLTGTTVPALVYLAIKDYTNNKLGWKNRLDDPQFNSYITEWSKTLRGKY